MKPVHSICLIIIALLNGAFSTKAQTLSSAKVSKLSLSEIEQEFYLKPYTTDSTKIWGQLKAKADSKNGKKIQLIQDVAKMNFCTTCEAEAAGFQLINFGTSDLSIEHIDSFIHAYNEVMQISLEANSKSSTAKQFTIPTVSSLVLQSETTNDSTFHITLKLAELDATFGPLSDMIQLEFNFVDAAFLPIKTTYETVKVKGVYLPNFSREQLILRLTIDLSKLPTDYTKCFCKSIQQRYHLQIPVSTIGFD